MEIFMMSLGQIFISSQMKYVSLIEIFASNTYRRNIATTFPLTVFFVTRLACREVFLLLESQPFSYWGV